MSSIDTLVKAYQQDGNQIASVIIHTAHEHGLDLPMLSSTSDVATLYAWLNGLEDDVLEVLYDRCIPLDEFLAPHCIVQHITAMEAAPRAAAASRVMHDYPRGHRLGILRTCEDELRLLNWYRTLPHEVAGAVMVAVKYNPRDYAPEWPEQVVNAKGLPTGKPKQEKLINVQTLLDHCGYQVRFNEMKHDVILEGTGFVDECAAETRICNIAREHGFTSDKIVKSNILEIAHNEMFHPMRDWLESIPWDGEDRFGPLMATITISHGYPQELAAVVLYRWLMGGVHALYDPKGVELQGVLVLVGKQGICKSRWIRSLVPHDMFLGGAFLNPKDKDDVNRIGSRFLAELGELDSSFRYSDPGRMKAYISQLTDVYRKPYASRDSTYARRTLLAGSVNERLYLNDNTGNRRWWSLPVQQLVPLHEAGIDNQQLWAQMKVLYDMGGDPARHYLTDEEQQAVNAINDDEFRPKDPMVEKFDAAFVLVDSEADNGAQWLSATEILCAAYGVETHEYTGNMKGDAIRLSKHLRDTDCRYRKVHNNNIAYLVKKRSSILNLVAKWNDNGDDTEGGSGCCS